MAILIAIGITLTKGDMSSNISFAINGLVVFSNPLPFSFLDQCHDATSLVTNVIPFTFSFNGSRLK